jgi:hypothetical protein
MNLRNLIMMATLVFAGVATVTFGGGPTNAAPPVCTVPGTHATIQAALADITCDTINLGPGAYAEDLIISRTLTLNGAQAGVPVSGRTFGAANESTLTGQITVEAADVTIDGLSLTNPGKPVAAFGILVKTAGSGAVIQNNIIKNVSSAACCLDAAMAQAIFLENGPDNVSILNNAISDIFSYPNATGILVGDESASNPSLNILIEGNTIEDISSWNRGTTGVQVTNGGSPPTDTGSYTEVTIRYNVIDDLYGGAWARGISLTGDTPIAVVEGNCISDVVDATPFFPVDDAVAVFFGPGNSYFGTAEVHQNNFTNVNYGIQVESLDEFPFDSVDGENNWWGSASGPGPVGPGTGVKVSPGVDYDPWLIAPALGGACGSRVTSTSQCKNGGWATVFRGDGTSFKNQGDCMQYLNGK